MVTVMASSKQGSDELAEVQATISSRAGNVVFLKKINLEKGGPKYLAISTNRIFLLSTKAPYKIETSCHFLEIQYVESTKPLVALLKSSNEKTATYVINTEEDDDILFVVAQMLAFLRYNFPGSMRHTCVELNVEPAERLSNIRSLAAALASPTPDSEVGPCGGFSLSYSSVCDLHGVSPMAEVIWDVDKIYGSHDCKDFTISDFDHLEVKELIPILGTFELNNWFKSFSFRSYKLSNELVDVLAKVLKSNSSIEELDLYECRLTRENIQKIAQAIASNGKTGLKRMNFGKNAMDDRGASSLSTCLSTLPHGLEALFIKDINITGKGISAICTALKSNISMSSSLTCLNISSNSLKVDGASAVCDLLANANVIQELNLSKTECSLDLVFGALARGCLQYLKVLNLSGNPQSYRKGKDLQIGPSVTKFFSSSMALQSINLSNTKIPPEFLKAVLIGLISNTHVKDVSLFLAGNELRSAGATEINSCISGLSNVIHLDLRDNNLDMDIINLCHSVQKNKSLQSLDLSQNIGKSKNVNVSGILESIVEMILVESLPLRKLSVADNRLKQDAGVLIDCLGTNSTLEEFDICGNLIGDEGARLLAKALQINTKLRKIALDRNGITLKGFQSLATSMQRNYSLQLIPVPFSDIYPLMKSNGEAVSKCFEKIDELLLRNQSMDIVETDHSIKLKQNILLSSLDHENTDRLLVQVQDAIDELKDADDDDVVAKEVENGRESIKDADKMKQVLFKLFVDVDDPSKRIEGKAEKLLKEMTDYADELVGANVTGTLSYLKEQCPTIAENHEAIEMLKDLISTKGKVDSLGLKEMIARTMVKLISSKVSDATLNVAFSFGEYITKIMQEELSRSRANLSLLSKEYKDKKQHDVSVKKGGSLPSTSADEKDESVLAAQKAKNRISTQFLSEDGKGTVKGKAVSRRPTFRREQDFQEVAVSIDIDDSPVTNDLHQEVEQGRIENEAISVENSDKQKDVSIKSEEKEDKPAVVKGAIDSNVETVDSIEKVEDSAGDMQESSIDRIETKGGDGRIESDRAKIPQVSEKDAINKADDTGKINDASSYKDLAENFKANLDGVKRTNSAFARPLQKTENIVDKKPRPLSDLSFVNLDITNTKELVHLNKGRAKPKGRRPPTKASGLAHLQESEIILEKTPTVAKENEQPKEREADSLKVSPKPRPKSMQPTDSPSPEKEMGVIRTGSIPHKSSESLLARLQAEKEKPSPPLPSKPDIRISPKPSMPKKDDSIKRPKPAAGKPLPGLSNKPNVQLKKNASPLPKQDTSTEEINDRKNEKSTDEGESADVPKETGSAPQKPEDNKEKEEKVAEKPKPKIYKPPGAVPMMGGPMGLGGALMAEMKKKRSMKNKDSEPELVKSPSSIVKSPKDDKTNMASPPSVATRPVAAARKPPPPAKLSAEKRKSLILDSGSASVIMDKIDGPQLSGKKIADTITEHAGADSKTDEATAESVDLPKEGHDTTVAKDIENKEQNNNDASERTA